ncbi:levanase [Spiroplasma chinense]|uniref:Levanase n=1 Tax=Spiroplasma chinense TaxID=216932 RepID=A0A5B9Y523_9MOLU|nr:glycoside hydrolase family 32 protein [Spiroplasma chinense]QEH62268.1 levanase [Spiroplasma chinense]
MKEKEEVLVTEELKKERKKDENYVVPKINHKLYSNLFHAQNPDQGMMNDIQGGFFRDGVWHIYFLQNADGDFDKYGFNHGVDDSVWYHITTKDWINWTYEGPGIPKNTPNFRDQATGTFYEDKQNIFGYDKNYIEGKDAKTIMAATTSFSKKGQNIMMWYTLDNGYTFTSVKPEPILWNPGASEHFRDPYFFIRKDKEGNNVFIMYLAEDDHFGVWVSNKPTSDYKKIGKYFAKHPMLECPNLFEMKVQGTNEKKWVLFYGGNGIHGKDADGLSIGTYYVVGTLDENFVFIEEPGQETKRLDFGPDYYAAKLMTLKQENTDMDSLLTTGWVSNWSYNFAVPNDGRYGNMSLAREIKLIKTVDGRYELKNEFVNFWDNNDDYDSKLEKVAKVLAPEKGKTQNTKNFLTDNNFEGKTYKLDLLLSNISNDEIVKIKLADDMYYVDVQIDFGKNEISVERKLDFEMVQGEEEFNKKWTYSAPDLDKNSKFEIYVDTTVIEFRFPDESAFTLLKYVDGESKEELSIETNKNAIIDFAYYQLIKIENPNK